MELDPILVQLMTGHVGFSSYLRRFSCMESPSCECSEDAEESALHMIADCLIYAGKRYNPETEINPSLNEHAIHEIIKSDNRERFLEYC